MKKLEVGDMVVAAKLHLAGTVVLLGVLFLSAAHSATYYVRPTSTNATCPHSPDPCLTLTEYGRNHDQHFNASDIELKLLPGIHVLEVSFAVANIRHVKLLGNSNSTEVLCTDDVGIVFENVSGLTIDGLMFTSCGRHRSSPVRYVATSLDLYGLFVDSVQHTMIANCTFQNSPSTALAVVNSSAVLENTSFLGNGKILSERCSASPNSNLCRVLGGGMLVAKSSLNFTGTTLFARNIAYRGGGICIENISTVIFSGTSTFTNNSVWNGDSGGGIAVQDNSILTLIGTNTFVSNSVSSQYSNSGGGGISAQDNSTLTLSGTNTFVRNSISSHYGNGGGVYAQYHTTVNMNGNTTFTHNSAPNGGGLCAHYHTTVSMNENTTFVYNSAYIGGAINVRQDRSTVNMNENTTFIHNSAVMYGGGIYAQDSTTVNMNENTTFIYNSAYNGGGGIYAKDYTTVNMNENTTFIHNSATDHVGGGGICAQDHTTVNMNGDTTFTYNSAVDGGGIYAFSHTTVNMKENTTFIHNSAYNGGGIYASYYTTVNMKENTTFTHNSAATSGGGVFAEGYTTVNMNENTNFIHNSAASAGGGINAQSHTILNMTGTSIFISNFGRDGGGILATQNSAIYLKGNNSFRRNRAGNHGGGISMEVSSTLTIHEDSILTFPDSANFVSNSARRGGAIYSSSSEIKVSAICKISNNSAHLDGGGVYSDHSTLWFGNSCLNNLTCSPSSTSFVSNSARRGGAIHSIFSEIKLSSAVSKISNNSAQLDGGGVYSDSSIFSFGNCTLNNNQAQIGAGIYLDNSTMNLTGYNHVEENVAVFYGAGIYTQRTLLTLTGNNAFRRNTAMREGGGIYAIASSTLDFNGNITFTDSVANVSGGAVWLENSILKLDSYTSFRNCGAAYEGGAIIAYDSHVKANGKSTFISNSATRGGAISVRWSSLQFYSGSELEVLNNSAVTGGGIFSDNSTLEFNENCTFMANLADYSGAGMYVARSIVRFFGNCYFQANQATENGGGIYARENSQVILCGVNNFENNSAERGGGVGLEDSTLKDEASNHASCFTYLYSTHRVTVNSFNTNHAATIGGGIFAMNGTLNLQGKNLFSGNTAIRTGGGVYAFDSSLHLPGDITFSNNSAVQYGGGLAAVLCKSVSMSGSTNMKWNSAYSGGAMYVDDSTVHIDGKNCFHDNMARAEGGVIHVTKSRVTLNGTNTFETNMAQERGGSIFTTCSDLIFTGNNLFQLSISRQGAAICASHSDLTFQGNTMFLNNTATHGGAIQVLLNSKLVFANSSHHTRIANELFCTGQTINGQSRSKNEDGIVNCIPQGSSFVSNTAFQGGAAYFDQSSKLYLDPASPLQFKGNAANESGGAIYVADVVGQHLDGLSSPFRNECFFHILMGQQSTHLDLQLSFQNNSARKRGSVLYGGLLNKCDFSAVMPHPNTTSAVDVFSRYILNDNEHSKMTPISSDPTEVCFCSNNRTECEEKTQHKSVFAGQRFDVSVLAVDQANEAIPAIFHADLNNENRSYIIANQCTQKEYTFTSANYVNQITLYPSRVSGETVELTVNIILKDCPPGFQLLNSSGKCECAPRLQQYTDDCDINKQAILRTGHGAGNFWVGVSDNNGTYDGLILNGNCPLNYCTRSKKYIHLNDSSEQCDFNRTGLLCGQCRDGESSILGSPKCRQCDNQHLLLLVVFAIAGVSLVLLLFLLNLTVAAGTIHGLIFYANIIASNHHIFLPRDQSMICTVFISWLNLDFGIETCFYNGMDTFVKTCLQFAFPLYVWTLVGALVYISRHSLLVSKLLGTNTIPVLATLFFLSYAKILHIILVALSLTSLHYPSGEEIVWLYDASIPRSWYIPLAVVAVLFLLFLFLPYTFLLLLGQWLRTKSDFWVLSWANNLYVKDFLDAYHAPYQLKHRYWTGLLLLLRCGLYLVFAFNVSGESSTNLLAISLAVLGVTVILLFTGSVYKNWGLNVLEISFIVNLGILAAATYHVTVVSQKGNSQVHGSQVATYISISVAFLTFLGILLGHIYLQIKSKMRRYKLNTYQIHRHANRGNLQPENQDLGNQPLVAPTRSFVQLREPLDLLDTDTL